MKKTLIVVVVLILVGVVIWKFTNSPILPDPGKDQAGVLPPTDTNSVPVSQTTKVSDKLSEYKNEELGYSVKYPTTWEKLESPSNVVFNIGYSDGKEKNTIGKLESKIDVVSGTCGFPPTTTIKERSSIKVRDLNLNMISMLNTVQGRSYFNRMYTLQKDSVCYYFTFSSITISPSNKGYSGADAQKIGARNVLLVDTADSQFKDMIKTFSFVAPPVGRDESQITPKK